MLKIKFSPLHSKYIFATRMKVFETNIEFKSMLWNIISFHWNFNTSFIKFFYKDGTNVAIL